METFNKEAWEKVLKNKITTGREIGERRAEGMDKMGSYIPETERDQID